MLDRRMIGLREGKTRYRENPQRLSKSCTAFRLWAALFRVEKKEKNVVE